MSANTCSIAQAARDVVVLVLAVVAAGCGTKTIFNDTFEADKLGEAPLAYPAGAPAGDRVVASPGGGARIVSDPALSGKAMSFVRSGPLSYMYFDSAPVGGTIQQFNISWDGHSPASQAGGGIALSVFAGHFRAAVELVFRQGKVYETTFIGGGDTQEQREIGTFEPGARHSVIIKLYRKRNTYDLRIHGVEPSGDGAGDGVLVVRDQRPILDPAVWAAETIGVMLMFGEAAGRSDDAYHIDNVSIRTGTP